MLAVQTIILPDTYRDSVFLMKLSVQARDESGAAQVSAMMGTERNKELFVRSGLSTPQVEAAKADDLVIAVQAEAALLDKALATVQQLLDAAPKKQAGAGEVTPQTLEQVLANDKSVTTVLISVAGDYARYEAAKALSAGLDVMLYSDNISLEDERALKKLAGQKGRLLMGPDCGTAIIDGVPFAFANTVRKGPVGLIAASGTGLQEVTCLLDRLGVGVSQAYGTGGRDLKDEIGGMAAFSALDRLLEDSGTRFIGILGKPPGGKTRTALLEKIKKSSKPVAVHYLGTSDYADEDAAGVSHADNLTDFSHLLATMTDPKAPCDTIPGPLPQAAEGKPGLLRGLFSGGTLCQEAAELAAPILGSKLYSNLHIAGFGELNASTPSIGHAFWDFGDDEFTVGRPHPMMAPDLRMQRLVQELLDPQVSVILADMVIGFGAASGQAELFAGAVREAEARSGGKSRDKVVVVSVCGTEGDRPSRSAESAILEKAGVKVLGSNARAAVWAASIAAGKDYR